MPAQISIECAVKIADACEKHYKALLVGGCDPDVAADRVWDALTCALERTELHCYDSRDSLLESHLRMLAQKGKP